MIVFLLYSGLEGGEDATSKLCYNYITTAEVSKTNAKMPKMNYHKLLADKNINSHKRWITRRIVTHYWQIMICV